MAAVYDNPPLVVDCCTTIHNDCVLLEFEQY